MGKGKFTFLQFSYFLSLIFFYKYVVVIVYSYMGYFEDQFSFYRFVISLIFLIFALVINNFIRNDFYIVTSQAILLLMFIPLCVFYIFNDISFGIILIYLIPLIFLFFISNLNSSKPFDRKILTVNNKNIFFFVLILLILVSPYLIELDSVNWRNLLFEDVYDTRANQSTSMYQGYMAAPLSKVILPILAIYAIEKRKIFILLLSLFFVCTIYLTTGAQKDILIGVLLIIFCYFLVKKNKYKDVVNYITLGITVVTALCTILYSFFGIQFVSNYLRRIFFIGPALDGYYYEYFSQNDFTLYTHTRIGNLLENDGERLDLTRWAGEHIIGNGTNANIGIFMEGYVSFGFLGVIISSILFTVICYLFFKIDIDRRYIGIWIATLYMVNFSLFDVLMVTHGLAVFIFISYFILPKNKLEER